ncbi:carboxy-S-adenosyl-L-methionine synthase CmoA [Alteromonas oceanisediminis]|uniref:carboxy-S-adenosyl-L-methionine synthase CmoA n=1 Tax=Alteromonas oceanisediminis TaxID=2836180 RepID=UPI001BDA3B57|nr:carboxy-S-adenosyl-L-methionine synthase CmoA [Alteromonas oceanisediminis]MBT0587140.1 carboxy-S-adenosyl-L-methionine synthase CmoA [Alteromonas oceanisediminis]
MTDTDQLFATPLKKVTDFSFDEQVADVFPDMISRSVPGYHEILKTIEQLAARYVQANTRIYDLGCSLGAASLAAAHGCRHNNDIVAIDNSQAMLSRCARYVSQFSHAEHIQLFHNDITDITIENASMVIMNFTLQFVDPEKRRDLLCNIYQGLKLGGILVLSEKFNHPDPLGNEVLIELHQEFKRANGYSELEISQKRAALENVMKLDTQEMHRERLAQVGFDSTVVYYQRFNFCSMVAIKS